MRRLHADMLQTVWNELNYRVDVCRINHKWCTYRAPVRYVTKTWSVVLLNKKIHILLSQVYCVRKVVKTPTIILNNPVLREVGRAKDLSAPLYLSSFKINYIY